MSNIKFRVFAAFLVPVLALSFLFSACAKHFENTVNVPEIDFTAEKQVVCFFEENVRSFKIFKKEEKLIFTLTDSEPEVLSGTVCEIENGICNVFSNGMNEENFMPPENSFLPLILSEFILNTDFSVCKFSDDEEGSVCVFENTVRSRRVTLEVSCDQPQNGENLYKFTVGYK